MIILCHLVKPKYDNVLIFHIIETTDKIIEINFFRKFIFLIIEQTNNALIELNSRYSYGQLSQKAV
jgi:hypothetical protein